MDAIYTILIILGAIFCPIFTLAIITLKFNMHITAIILLIMSLIKKSNENDEDK